MLFKFKEKHEKRKDAIENFVLHKHQSEG